MQRLQSRLESCCGLKGSAASRRATSPTKASVMGARRCRKDANAHRMLLTCCSDSSCARADAHSRASMAAAEAPGKDNGCQHRVCFHMRAADAGAGQLLA